MRQRFRERECVFCPDKSSLSTETMGIRPSSLGPDITTFLSFVSCDSEGHINQLNGAEITLKYLTKALRKNKTFSFNSDVRGIHSAWPLCVRLQLVVLQTHSLILQDLKVSSELLIETHLNSLSSPTLFPYKTFGSYCIVTDFVNSVSISDSGGRSI